MLDSMNMKKRMRSAEEEEEISICTTNHVGIEEMAKCLMLLSHHYQNVATNNNNGPIQAIPISMYRAAAAAPKELSLTRFECKTCNRSFSSFQALGGHRASHKKPRGDDTIIMKAIKAAAGGGSSRKHACSICGVVFSMGQALGGHMRRHRECRLASPSPPVVVLKRSTSHLKVSSINTFLDLNLTPLENLKLLFGKY